MRKAFTQTVGMAVAYLIIGGVTHAQVEESKISINISKEVNGKTENFKRTYQSHEEMEADEELKAFTQDDIQVKNNFNGSGHQATQINQTSESYIVDVDTEMNKTYKKMKGLSELDDDSLSSVLNAKIRKFEQALANMEKDFIEEIEILKEMDWAEIRERHKIKLIEEEKVVISENPTDESQKKLTISAVDSDEFGKIGTVAEKELLIIPELDYYPNPSSGRFQLRFQVEESGPLNIKVYNIKGQEVYVRYFPRFSGRFTETIDLSVQTEGIYLLEISHNQRRLTRKVLIQ